MSEILVENARVVPIPEDNEKCRQVLDGARKVFLSKGFEGASMDQIAKAAGVSKGTLYVYFPSKEHLFQALVLKEKSKLAENFVLLETPSGDPHADLAAMLRGFAFHLFNSDHIASVRMVIGAADSFPEMGARFYNSGPVTGIARVSRFLESETAAGRMNVRDPEMAAGHLMDLTTARLLRKSLFCSGATPDQAEIDRHIAAGLDVFMAFYGAKS